MSLLREGETMNYRTKVIAIGVVCAGIVAVAIGSFSFFKPKPISGQLFVVTQASLNIPLGAVQIEMVKQKDIDDFMKQRQAEIDSRLQSLQKAYDSAKTECVKAAQDQEQAQTALQEKFMAYTNDVQYVALQKERVKVWAAFQAQVKKLGPTLMNMNTFYETGYTSQPELAPLADRMREIDRECVAIRDKNQAPLLRARDYARDTLTLNQNRLDAAATALEQFPTATDYLRDFSPMPVGTTVTDANGNFTIQHPGKGTKVFAKAQRQVLDSEETFFGW